MECVHQCRTHRTLRHPGSLRLPHRLNLTLALTALLPLLRMGKPSQNIHSITNRWVHPIHHRRPVHPASLYHSCRLLRPLPQKGKKVKGKKVKSSYLQCTMLSPQKPKCEFPSSRSSSPSPQTFAGKCAVIRASNRHVNVLIIMPMLTSCISP